MEMVRGPGEQLGLGLARQPDTRAIIIETIRQVLHITDMESHEKK